MSYSFYLNALQCPKCGRTAFQVNDITIGDTSFLFKAIQCKNCKAVISIIPATYIPETLKEIKEKLNAIEKKIK